MADSYKHIFLTGIARSEKYKIKGTGITLSEEQYKKYLVLINVSVYNNYTDTFIAGL